MSKVGQRERATQERVVKLLRDRLGYEYLGNWQYRAGNSNIEERYLRALDLVAVARVALAVGDNTVRVWNTAAPRDPYAAVLLWKGIQAQVRWDGVG